MNILIAYETVHGSTRSIAENIGRALGRYAVVTVCPMHDAARLDQFDAFVLGGAEQGGAWLPQACTFVQDNAELLGHKPVWLFAVGISAARPRLLRDASVRREERELRRCALTAVHPRGTRVFSGLIDSERLSSNRVTRLLPRARLVRPGDYRQWPQIIDWAHRIAADLADAPAA